MITKKWIKSYGNKVKFALGQTPRIDRFRGKSWFIPEGYKSICLISADFEMAWASRYSKNYQDPSGHSITDALRTRENMPSILSLCDKYKIPITWATVGHLFMHSCTEEMGIKHADLPRIPYFENQFWSYNSGDWYDSDPCTDYLCNPEWYAPDIVKEILSTNVGHEIACHTFSHIDCRDALCSDELFYAEVQKCIEHAAMFGVTLKSFVHPGHQIGHLDDLTRFGFRSYRSNDYDTLGIPKLSPLGIWEFKNTAELTWRSGWSAAYHIKRLKQIIDRAIRWNMCCVFWFHPSLSTRYVHDVMPALFAYLQFRSKDIKIMTHYEYSSYLDTHENTGKL